MEYMAEKQFVNYQSYKTEFDGVMKRTVGNFVSIGYFLKVARDTDILRESGYATMGEFAQKEYGISESQASRFIAVADKYGDGRGNLLGQYREYSYSLLSEMLTLPEVVAQEISADMTRDEVRELKAEIGQEQAVTPLEVLMEGQQEEEPLTALLKAWFHENPSDYARALDVSYKTVRTAGMSYSGAVLDALAPGGIAILVARVQGVGRLMLSFKGAQELPVLINTRTNEREQIAWEKLFDTVDKLTEFEEDLQAEGREEEVRAAWRELYGEDYPNIEQKSNTGGNDDKKTESVQKEPVNDQKPAKSDQKPAKSEQKQKEKAAKTEKKVRIARAQEETPHAESEIETAMNPPEEPAPAAGLGEAVERSIRMMEEAIGKVRELTTASSSVQIREVADGILIAAQGLDNALSREEAAKRIEEDGDGESREIVVEEAKREEEGSEEWVNTLQRMKSSSRSASANTADSHA